MARNVDQTKASGPGIVHRIRDRRQCLPDQTPPVHAHCHDGDLPSLKVLLIGKVLVRGEQDFESRLLGRVQQLSIQEPPHPIWWAVLMV
jgi:hypothetical protein